MPTGPTAHCYTYSNHLFPVDPDPSIALVTSGCDSVRGKNHEPHRDAETEGAGREFDPLGAPALVLLFDLQSHTTRTHQLTHGHDI